MVASVWRTVWNGWCTKARTEQKFANCVLGCGGEAADRIEHYALCKYVRWLSEAAFGMSAAPSLARFLLLQHGMDQSEMVKMAVIVHAMYTVTNAYRKKVSHCESEIKDALSQVVKDVCGGMGITAFGRPLRNTRA